MTDTIFIDWRLVFHMTGGSITGGFFLISAMAYIMEEKSQPDVIFWTIIFGIATLANAFAAGLS